LNYTRKPELKALHKQRLMMFKREHYGNFGRKLQEEQSGEEGS